MLITISVWIVVTTAGDPQCKNGGTNESKLHPICTCPPGFKGFDCSQRGKQFICCTNNICNIYIQGV